MHDKCAGMMRTYADVRENYTFQASHGVSAGRKILYACQHAQPVAGHQPRCPPSPSARPPDVRARRIPSLREFRAESRTSHSARGIGAAPAGSWLVDIHAHHVAPTPRVTEGPVRARGGTGAVQGAPKHDCVRAAPPPQDTAIPSNQRLVHHEMSMPWQVAGHAACCEGSDQMGWIEDVRGSAAQFKPEAGNNPVREPAQLST